MAQDKSHLIWIDLEMSGLVPTTDRILELAVVVTTSHLDVVAEAPVLVVHQDETVLDRMDAWNKSTHGRSGLIDRVRASPLDERAAEARLLEFLAEYVPSGESPMCGNSVCQDRRFLAGYMPGLEAWFHYRNLDVSTLKELARRWKPTAYAGFKKENRHEALADIHESIAELKHYREHLLAL